MMVLGSVVSLSVALGDCPTQRGRGGRLPRRRIERVQGLARVTREHQVLSEREARLDSKRRVPPTARHLRTSRA